MMKYTRNNFVTLQMMIMQNLKNLSYQEYRLMIDNCIHSKEFSLEYPALFNMIIDDPKILFKSFKILLGMKIK